MFEKAAFLNPLNGSAKMPLVLFGGTFSTLLWFELKLTVFTGFFSVVKTLIHASNIDCLL
jgi:hypothetical protein